MKKWTFIIFATIFFALSGISYGGTYPGWRYPGGTYISLYTGGAFPNDSDWNDNIGLSSSGTIGLDNSGVFGLKSGIWLIEVNAPYLGLEYDINVAFPDWNSITTDRAFGIPLTPSPLNTVIVTADTVVISQFVNVLLRYPKGPVKPYAGAGIGLGLWAVGDQTIPGIGTFSSESAVAFTWDFLAGVDFKINDSISLFGEYKYIGANYSFTTIGLDIDYRTSQANVGITAHF